ncbi:MAG: hypothetical protein IT468_08685, partial [Rhodocyclaceae bacterium]|nr:hypothetical protein [Rhodocyclaceae bacterium]
MADASLVRPLVFVRHPRRSRLARLGDWMVRHRRAILGLQWLVVLFYGVLVALPAFLPLPHAEARLFAGLFGASAGQPEMAPYAPLWYERMVLAAQYLFWGVWWPFVILSIMFMGRIWCGVL